MNNHLEIKITIKRNFIGRILQKYNIVKPKYIKIGLDFTDLRVNIFASDYKMLENTIINGTGLPFPVEFRNNIFESHTTPLQKLEWSLKQAEQQENFEIAAKIRDEIKKLKNE